MKAQGSAFTISIVGIALLASPPMDALAAAPTWSTTATHAYVSKGAAQTGAALNGEPLSVVVSLRLRNRSQLETVAQSVSGSGAPPITHDEFMSTYAPTEAQGQAVASYLSAMGFSNVAVDDNRLLVSADGTVGTAAAAFNTSFAHFTLNGKSGLANVTDAQVPSALANVVLAVLGLQTVESPTALAMLASPRAVNSQTGAPPPAGPQGHNPTAFPLVYSANALPTGSSAHVGIISDGSQTLTQQVIPDLQLFESKNGLPILTPTIVTVGSPSSDPNGILEWDLDSQNIQAMAGGSLGSLTFYAANSLSDGALAQAYSKVVSDNTAKIINVSLAECEATAYNDGAIAADDQSFLSAVAQGQTFSVASGDNGSRTCGASGNGTYGTSVSVAYPASSAYVTAVGGTSVVTNADGTWSSETAWSYSGGGSSAYEQPTQWTQGVTSVPGEVFRVIPDVSMDADPNSGALIAYNNNYPFGPVGGTSLASPLFVGAWARIETAQGNALGYANPLIYSLTVPMAPFHDITSGNNDDYSAGQNWDYTTGWGSLIASTLSIDLAALPTAPASISDSNGGVACPSDIIDWSAVSGATSYELHARESQPTPADIYTLVWTGAGNSSTQTLNTGYAYDYRVKACTSDGCSQLSTADLLISQGICQ